MWLYALPYDERPCFLLGDAVAPLTMQPGQARKEPYADEKNGSCTLRAALAPLTGQRLGLVRTQRTKKEYTEFCQAFDERQLKNLVNDN